MNFFSNSHILQYRGYTCVYEANYYRIALLPYKSFMSFSDAQREIDRIEEERIKSENNILNEPPTTETTN